MLAKFPVIIIGTPVHKTGEAKLNYLNSDICVILLAMGFTPSPFGVRRGKRSFNLAGGSGSGF